METKDIQEVKGEHKRETHAYAVQYAVFNAAKAWADGLNPWADSRRVKPIPVKVEIEVKNLEGQYIAYLRVIETVDPNTIPNNGA